MCYDISGYILTLINKVSLKHNLLLENGTGITIVHSVKKMLLTRCLYVSRFSDAFKESGRSFHIVGTL